MSYKVRENLAYHRCKLESVSRTWRRNNDVRIAWKTVDDEVTIGRDSVKAGRGFDAASVRAGEIIGER